VDLRASDVKKTPAYSFVDHVFKCNLLGQTLLYHTYSSEIVKEVERLTQTLRNLEAILKLSHRRTISSEFKFPEQIFKVSKEVTGSYIMQQIQGLTITSN
jgi:hypothetical protein